MTHPVPDSAETRGLLDRVKAGEPEAFDQLFARHRSFLRQVVELRMDRRVRGRVDPSDVVQEAQLDAFQRLADYIRRRPMPFRLWLRKTAYERLLKVQRRHLGAARRNAGREVALPAESSAALAEGLLGADSAPSHRAERAELAARLRSALDELPEADREVLVLRNFEGLSNPEAGYLLGLDPAAVSKRHGRALLRLREVLWRGGHMESGL